MWRILIGKLVFAVCADSSGIEYLRRILFDLAYGKKGKKKYIQYRLQESIGAKILLRHAFDGDRSQSCRFRFYQTMYYVLLLAALPSYAALCGAHVLGGGGFSWLDIAIGVAKIMIWLFLRLHFDRSMVSIYVR